MLRGLMLCHAWQLPTLQCIDAMVADLRLQLSVSRSASTGTTEALTELLDQGSLHSKC